MGRKRDGSEVDEHEAGVDGTASAGASIMAESSEETPLLLSAISPADALRQRYRAKVIILSMVLIFLADLGAGLMGPPLTAMMEDLICRESHPAIKSGFLNGMLFNDPICKSPDVQGKLAMLRGWMSTFDCIPGFLVAVPFGLLSDKWGRKPVMSLSGIGIVLSIFWILFVFAADGALPVWTILLSSTFLFIGGGSPTLVAMIFTFLADVTPAAERATVFFQVMSIGLLSQLISGPLAGILMLSVPAWTTLLIAMALIVAAALSIFLYPETLEIHRINDLTAIHAAEAPSEPDSPKEWNLRIALRESGKSLREAWDFVIGNKRVSFLLVSLVFVFLGRFVQDMLLQYATKRYGWSWSKASFLLSIRFATNLVVLVMVLPALSWLLVHRLGVSALAKDLLLARASTAALVLGALAVALASNGYILSIGLVVLAAGGGQGALVRSLANALVEEHHVGIVNTLVGFLENVGLMVAGPLLSESLRVGMDMGGAWIGLPFFVATILFSFALGIVFAFRIPDRRRPSADELL